MTNIDYEVGLIKAQVEALQKSMDELTETVSTLSETVGSVDKQITTWKSNVTGATAVFILLLNIIGAAVLWLGDNLIAAVKIKLGF